MPEITLVTAVWRALSVEANLPGTNVMQTQVPRLPDTITLPIGSTLSGNIAGREQRQNGGFILRTAKGDLVIKTDLPLGVGSKVELVIEGTGQQFQARIATVDGKPVEAFKAAAGAVQAPANPPAAIIDSEAAHTDIPLNVYRRPAHSAEGTGTSGERSAQPVFVRLQVVQPNVGLLSELARSVNQPAETLLALFDKGRFLQARLIPEFQLPSPPAAATATPPTSGGIPQTPTAAPPQGAPQPAQAGTPVSATPQALPSAALPSQASGAPGIQPAVAPLIQPPGVEAGTGHLPLAQPGTPSPFTGGASSPLSPPATGIAAQASPSTPLPTSAGTPAPSAATPPALPPSQPAALPPSMVPPAPITPHLLQDRLISPATIAARLDQPAILQSPAGTFLLPGGVHLPTPDGSYRLEISLHPPVAETPGILTEETAEDPRIARLQTIDHLLVAMKGAEPSFHPLMADRLPHPDHKLTSGLMFMLSALTSGNIRKLFGDAAIDILEHVGLEEAVGKAAQELGNLTQTVQDRAGFTWNNYTFPLYDQEKFLPLYLFVRQDGGRDNGTAASPEDGARFVFELELSALGNMQFDGFYRKQAPQRYFDLAVRSAEPLPDDVRSTVIQLFEDALAVTGMKGALTFHLTRDFMKPLLDEKPESAPPPPRPDTFFA